MKNKRVTALTLAGLLSFCPLFALAVEKTGASAVPPAALPGVNQGGTEAKEDKADKKGEEASGANSGADAETLERDAESKDDGSKQSSDE
jgi:hypothetical protein